MKRQHQQLERLQEAWSAEMATFRELQEGNKALIGELHELIDRLDIPASSGSPGPVTG